jgi:hypothetical protein
VRHPRQARDPHGQGSAARAADSRHGRGVEDATGTPSSSTSCVVNVQPACAVVVILSFLLLAYLVVDAARSVGGDARRFWGSGLYIVDSWHLSIQPALQSIHRFQSAADKPPIHMLYH